MRLNYHHSKFETLFDTQLALEFCDSWRLAASALGSYEACGVAHGPSADDYIAWLISMDKEFNYVPKNKGRVGGHGIHMLIRYYVYMMSSEHVHA